MQDIQNIPNPDVNSAETGDDFNTYSDVNPDSRSDRDSQDMDIEKPAESTPTPPDREPNVAVEDPPLNKDDSAIGEGEDKRTRLV